MEAPDTLDAAIAQWGAREDLICAQVFESVLGLTD